MRSTPKPRGSGTHSAGTHVVATGGGPGAMEAANLGCYLAGSHRLRGSTTRVAALAEVPAFRPSVDAWLRPALEVREGVAEPHDSLGIPTWHYGHEPLERLRHRHREVLPQPRPRGDPPRGLRRRHRLPPRRRRHRPGGVPGRLRELLRRRVLGRRDGPGRPHLLDRDHARLAAAPRRWPAAARWRTACTWSTPSTRPSTCSPDAESAQSAVESCRVGRNCRNFCRLGRSRAATPADSAIRRRARGSRSSSRRPRGSARRAPR